MENTYVPSIGDRVFLHELDNSSIGRFYSVIDINKDTMAIQACDIVGDHLEETEKLDIVLLDWDKKLAKWVWNKDKYQPIQIATFMNVPQEGIEGTVKLVY